VALADIDHVVVLMLENRSFDCLLGKLYPSSDVFDGLPDGASNNDIDGNEVMAWSEGAASGPEMSLPDPDPGELFTDINTQLFGTPDVPDPVRMPTMSGFVRSFLSQTAKPAASYAANAVMHYYQPEQVPVLSTLAKTFAVCDRWHASAPCQTWPNRFFTHCATANGWVNNDPPHFPYEMPTIFERLQATRHAWNIYFHDMPQALTLSRLWTHLDRFRLYAQFQHDARQGTLPSYSFIEPRYFPDLSLPNDQHPPHVVTLGEQLIADVYNCLRAGPGWSKTLLIVTYDEHGGCFDHVPPPAAVSPGDAGAGAFRFDRYGVRVPVVIVSPYVSSGTIFRPPAGQVCDHTSIIATLHKRFSLGGPLTPRDAAAPDLEAALTLPEPNNLGPAHLDALPYAASPTDIAAAQVNPLNSHQKALLQLAAHLPAAVSTGSFEPFITSFIDQLRTGASAADGDVALPHDPMAALGFIKGRLGNLFRSL
jgi:phospholipase C